MSYEGWKNKETWTVSLWIDNDEGLYRQVNEMAEEAEDKNDLAESIESIVDEIVEMEEVEHPMLKDLISTAIGKIDWHEIAENHLGE